MILPTLFVAPSTKGGRGMFTTAEIDAGVTIEISPVIIMSAEERKILDQTLMHDYIFEWGADHSRCCVALGYVSIYNHSYRSNCEYEMDFDQGTISIKTVSKIKAGEELLINYNGDWNDDSKIWFDVR